MEYSKYEGFKNSELLGMSELLYSEIVELEETIYKLSKELSDKEDLLNEIRLAVNKRLEDKKK